ncbi:MAG: hypothetical protein ABL973_17820 [Micropepsaceae bacterium]
MARLGSASTYDRNYSPTDRAYNWGRKGVEVEPPLVRNWLGWHTETSLQLRVDNLKRRVHGSGVRFHHSTTIFLGVGVFLAALFVDYNIIHEFWTRALSNEFGEVPAGLATTVAAKSMQVLFGTLAIHYLISHIGHGGRVAYSLFIFAITAVMIVGIGLLWANNSLPAGSQVFGFDVNSSAQSVDEFMKSLGVKPPRAAPIPAEVKALKKYEVIIWLFSLGVIFLVVASIGAMALHSAMRGFTGMTGGALYDSHADARHGNRVRDDLKHAELDLKLFQKDEGIFARSKLSEFVSVYTEGVVAGGYRNGTRKRLLDKASSAAQIVLAEHGGGYASSDDNVEDINDYRQRPAAHAGVSVDAAE